MQAYATWQVMRRLRASAENRQARTPTANARNNVRAAASLLAWLRSRHTTLTDCQQGDIDQWLHTGPSASLARDFLTWAASRRHAQQFDIPAPLLPGAEDSDVDGVYGADVVACQSPAAVVAAGLWWWCCLCLWVRCRSGVGDFGDGGAGGLLVDDGLAGGVGGDQGLDGQVVDRAGVAAGGGVDQGRRIIAE